MIAYLQSRGIDREVIDVCIQRGSLYESAKTHNCVFVGRDSSGAPRFASMRGTFSNYKQDAAGSDKRYGFCFSPCGPPGRMIDIFESPADALSLATHRKRNGEAWAKYHYLSLGGTSPLALTQFLKDHGEADYICLRLDNDHAGRNGILKIKEALHGTRVMTVTEKPPEKGKDYNEYLQHVLRGQKELSEPIR